MGSLEDSGMDKKEGSRHGDWAIYCSKWLPGRVALAFPTRLDGGIT